MRMFQRLADLGCNVHNALKIFWSSLRKSWASHEFHDEKRLTISFAYIVNCDDMWMIERGSSTSFAQKTLTAIGVSCSCGKDLDRNLALQFEVSSTIDDSHATASKFAV